MVGGKALPSSLKTQAGETETIFLILEVVPFGFPTACIGETRPTASSPPVNSDIPDASLRNEPAFWAVKSL